MRIPLNSCKGCNEDLPLFTGGIHIDHDGNSFMCAFVQAELADWPKAKFIGVYLSRAAAIRKAQNCCGALLHSGQGLYEMWLVLRD